MRAAKLGSPTGRTGPPLTNARGGWLRRILEENGVSIRARLAFLAMVLLAGIVGTNLYLIGTLHTSSDAAIRADHVIRAIQSVRRAREAFDTERYWLTDLAVSQLTHSEHQAAAARQRLGESLIEVGRRDPEAAAAIAAENVRFYDTAIAAVGHYTADRRVVGNTVFATARKHGLAIDALLVGLTERYEAEGGQIRSSVVGSVATATQVSIGVLAAALLIGLALTWLILRSITRPLDRLVRMLREISNERFDTPLPRMHGREFSAILQVAALLRASQAEQHRLSAEAERQRRTLADAVDTLHEAFALWDAQDRLVLWNARFEHLMPGLRDLIAPGLRLRTLLEQAVARDLADLGERTPEAWLAWRLEEHATVHETREMRFGRRWMNLTMGKIRDGGTVMLYADITELKKREAELERARADAEKANVVKSAFMANMSHELRTPLNAIIGYSQILREDAEEAGQDDFVADLTKIERAGNHLLNLINSILDLSKIEAGKVEISLETVTLPALVEDVRLLIEPLMKKNRNHLKIVIEPGLDTLFSDAVKLKQSLLNLLSNAAKFSKDSTVLLDVARDASGGLAVFRVTDQGIGMTEEQMGRLFQAFQQADASTTRKYGGTGLGLTITRSFARLLGGDVTVSSRPGVGSTFTLTVPVAPGSGLKGAGAEASDAVTGSAAEARLPSGTEARTAQASVLVVDDEPSSQHIIGSHLAREGFHLLYAASGPEAVAIARTRRPDAITLDIIMPGTDGWTTLQMLKADPLTAAIPVVLISVLAERRTGLRLGASEVLSKPIDRSSLVAAIKAQRPDGPAPILIVAGDPDLRARMQVILERLGHRTALAGDAAEALTWLDRNPTPGLVLLDLPTDGSDNLAFLREFRARSGGAPVIVLPTDDSTHTARSSAGPEAISPSKHPAVQDHALSERLDALVRSALAPGRRTPELASV